MFCDNTENDASRGNRHVREENENAKVAPFKFLLKTVQMHYCPRATGDIVKGKKTFSIPGHIQASENERKAP